MPKLTKTSLLALSFIFALPALAGEKDISCTYNDNPVNLGEKITFIKESDQKYWGEYKAKNGFIPDGAYNIWLCAPVVSNPKKPSDFNQAAWVDVTIK